MYILFIVAHQYCKNRELRTLIVGTLALIEDSHIKRF